MEPASRQCPFRPLLLLLLLCTVSVDASRRTPVSTLVHGWDCIACQTNTMLAGNFGHSGGFNNFNMSNTWWIDQVAKHYAAVALSDFLFSQFYNGTGENGMVTVARALKASNPKIKILFYQAADRGGLSTQHTAQIFAHPEWWLRNDAGQIVWWSPPTEHDKGHPVVDMANPELQNWFINLSLSFFSSKEEAKELCDGVFVDGAGYYNNWQKQNVSNTLYNKWFDGKMQMMENMQNLFTEMNGGEVWGNGVMNINQPPNPFPGLDWTTALKHFNGAFDEKFGCLWVDNPDGSWNVSLMQKSFETIINVSNSGHTVVIHDFPGPTTVPFLRRGSGDNSFTVATWAGPEKVPNTTEGCRQAAAEKLIDSLAPFLIVVNERVFLSYAWFYNIEDGYIPCEDGVECGMPTSWYPEFSRPLGPPKSGASRNGTVWTREFEHASVYVDLSDRSLSKVTWH